MFFGSLFYSFGFVYLKEWLFNVLRFLKLECFSKSVLIEDLRLYLEVGFSFKRLDIQDGVILLRVLYIKRRILNLILQLMGS